MMNNGSFKGAIIHNLLLIFGWPILMCLSIAASAQDFEVDPNYVLDQWTVEDGLPVNNVVDILQAKNGYLWLATFDGLVRFDGVDFKIYQSERYPTLPTNRILTVDEASDGSIWMTTEQGFIVKFKDGQFTHIRERDGLNGELGNILYKDRQGVIWIATTKGISSFDGVNLTPHLPNEISGNIQNLYVDSNGASWYKKVDNDQLFRTDSLGTKVFPFGSIFTYDFFPVYDDPQNKRVWVGIGNTIYNYTNGELTFHSTFSHNDAGIVNFYTNKSGNIFLFDRNNDAYSWSIEEKRWVLEYEGRYNPRDYNFLISTENSLWFISGEMVYENQNKILETSDQIYSYLIDREGSLWIGTQTLGLLRLKKNLFKTYTEKDGLPFDNVYSIIEDYKNDIWVATYREGAGVIDQNGTIDSVEIENTAYGGFLTSLFMGKDSTIYTGSIGAGVAWLEPGDSEFRKERNFGSDDPIQIKGFYEDRNGDLWLGTPNGLFIGEVGNWNKVKDERFTNFPVRMIKLAPDSSLWIGTNGAGIVRYHMEKFTFYGTERGFISNLFRSFHFSDIQSPEEYTLWVGTEDLGLVRVEVENGEPNLKTLTRFGTQTGLLDYAIHSIQEDEYGFFWLNTNRGIYRIEKEQLVQYHRGEIENLKGISFTESDGLLNREGNGGNQSSGITASDGRIWFANQAGAVVFDPADFLDTEIPPVVIEEIATTHKTVIASVAKDIELQKNERDFEINFTALSLAAPERNNFRYRLVGYNEEWIETNEQRSAIYTNIPNGTYTFEVTASNNTGKWNPEPAQMTLTIAPYFYETTWFNFGLFALIGMLLYVGIQWRIRSLKNSEELLKKQVKERTKELEIEKEKTEKQAERLRELDIAKTRFFTNISHELRTPLTLIVSPLQQMLSEKADAFDSQTKDEFRRMLRNSDRLLRLIDQTLDLTRLEKGKVTMQVQKISLLDFLEELVEMFTYIASEKDIELHFNTDGSDFEFFADSDKLDKIIANLMSNAIKFTPSGGSIQVSLTEKDHSLVVKVADTGIGIAEKYLDRIFERFYQIDASETRFHEGSGIGLSLVKEFIELHSAEISVDSTLNTGTTFSLFFKKGKEHFSEEELIPENEAVSSQKVILNDLQSIDHQPTDTSFTEDQTTVLIVEDNTDLRDFIEKILADQYRVITAANGEEGINLVQQNMPDLIVADIMMPKVDGITFNRMLKEEPATASIPLIFLTAKSTKKDQIEGLAEGGDAYLTKPFDPAILKARIKNLITSRFRLREVLSHQDPALSNEKSKNKDPFVEEVNHVIAKHFTDPDFSVNQLAKELYMDRSQLLRKLKAAADLSPSALIKKFRMEKAAELLQTESDSISEVAYAVGFKSLSYFSFCFKEYFEMSPSEFIVSNN
ncbi:MAG: two-component regulator propeller domain-containing protein [Gracilimonas sp.]|nr:two-component regulator propeller domain-containing protein [Gracilimonas sp.]